MRILFLLPLLFVSCYFNERGISSTYYNDCKEYYDAAGVYHKVCDENLVNFSDFTTKKNNDIDLAIKAQKIEQEKNKQQEQQAFEELDSLHNFLENEL